MTLTLIWIIPGRTGTFPAASAASIASGWQAEARRASGLVVLTFSVAEFDFAYFNDWLWDRDEIVLYGEPDRDGSYLVLQHEAGYIYYVQYLGPGKKLNPATGDEMAATAARLGSNDNLPNAAFIVFQLGKSSGDFVKRARVRHDPAEARGVLRQHRQRFGGFVIRAAHVVESDLLAAHGRELDRY